MKKNKIIGGLFVLIAISFLITGCSFDNVTPQKEETPTTIMSYDEWLQSDMALDYNQDNAIDTKDYVEYVNFEKWKDSNNANDLNGDKKITYEDYLIFAEKGKTGYDAWIISTEKGDFDKDGDIDQADYNMFLIFGTYCISDFNASGRNWYIGSDQSVTLFTLAESLGDSTIVINKDGFSIKYGQTVSLTQESKTEIQSTLSSLKLSCPTLNLLTLVLTTELEQTPTNIKFYLAKQEGSVPSYSTETTFIVNDLYTTVSFKVTKI